MIIEKTKMKNKMIIFTVVLFAFVVGCTTNSNNIESFEECVEASGVVQESLPRICVYDEIEYVEDKDLPLDSTASNNNPKVQAYDCLDEQRNVDGCIEIYQPVCGQMMVECITTPCNPIKQTFENSCKACANVRVLSYTQGECEDSNDIKK